MCFQMLLSISLASLGHLAPWTLLDSLGPHGCSWGLLASGSSWRLLAALGNSWRLLGAPGGSWRLLGSPSSARLQAVPGKPRRFLAASGSLLTSSLYLLTEKTLSQHDIVIILHQESILLSDHRLLCHLLVGPLSSYLASGGPTIYTYMRQRKSVSIISCPAPLSHHTRYCCLQSRYSTKCSGLKL